MPRSSSDLSTRTGRTRQRSVGGDDRSQGAWRATQSIAILTRRGARSAARILSEVDLTCIESAFVSRSAGMRLVAFPPLIGLTVAGAVACAAPRAPEEIRTLDDALSAQEFDTTVQHLTALPWLPWAYTADGCYARAEYYSMLLASRGVPTNHLYALARPGTTLGGMWRWHVAPLVTKDGDPNHLYVLDPVYDQSRALTNVEWIARQGHSNPNADEYPYLHVHPGNSYLDQNLSALPLVNPSEPNASVYKEPTFEAMPAFKMFVIAQACKTMHLYIDREPGTSEEQKSDKHTSLGRETKRIVGVLAAKGKLDGDSGSLYRNCTRDPLDKEDPGEGWGGWGSVSRDDFVEPTR
jgi:hypothetical protein